MSIYFFSVGGKVYYINKHIGIMNNDKLICIRDEDDTKLTTLLSDGWKIIQISASGIYCWVLLRKTNNTKKKIKGFQ